MTVDSEIERFRLQVDDDSELSSTEELALANEVYDEIANDRPWEWLKSTATGTTSTSVSYIALPADFKTLSPNKDNRSVIFVGTDYNEYQVVPFSSRRDYRNVDGYCYIDVPNQRLYFTLQPTSAKAVEYDYIKRHTALVAGASPLFTMNNLIAYGMASKFNPIEQTEKSVSYRQENTEAYKNLLSNLQMEDTLIKLQI